MIAAIAWCGIFYSLAGGQPMMINGGTGPVLAFTEILYKMSESMDVPFLTLNAWIGIWVCIYMVLAAVTDLNRIISLCTRFTDEIFSFLIALIFIINAIGGPFSNTGVLHYLYGPQGSRSVRRSRLLLPLGFGTAFSNCIDWNDSACIPVEKIQVLAFPTKSNLS